MRSAEELQSLRHRLLMYFGIPACVLLVVVITFHQAIEEGEFSPRVRHLDIPVLITTAILILTFKIVEARLLILEQQARKRAEQRGTESTR